MLADLFSIFFRDVSVVSYGQEADAIPLPATTPKIVGATDFTADPRRVGEQAGRISIRHRNQIIVKKTAKMPCWSLREIF